MKKIKTVALATMMGVGAVAAFAAPKSNIKASTNSLFSDGLIDSLSSGIKGDTGFVFTGFDMSQFHFGAGMWANENVWVGAYYQNNNNWKETFKDSITRTYNTTGDVVDTVDTTTVSSATVDGTANSMSNNVVLDLYLKNSGLGFAVDWTGTTTDNGTASSTTVENKPEQGLAKTVVDNDFKETWVNNWSVGLKGIQLKKDNGFYLSLGSVGLKWTYTAADTKDKTDITYYGSLVGAGDQIDNKTVQHDNKFEPSVSGGLGFNLPAVGNMKAAFSLGEKLYGTFDATRKSQKDTKVTTTLTEVTTVETTGSYNYLKSWTLGNTLTPSVKYTVAAGDNVKVAFKPQVVVDFNYNNQKPHISTTHTVTTTANTVGGTSITDATTTSFVNGTQNVNTFTTTLTPSVAAGVVWSVKPEKLDFNFGLNAKAGNLKWVTTAKTNSDLTKTEKTVSTDVLGQETVTKDTMAAVNDGSAEESVETVYTWGAGSASGSLGATIYMSDKVSLDCVLSSGNFGMGTFFTGADIKAQLKVRF